MSMFASISPEHFEGTIDYGTCRINGNECYGCVYCPPERIVPYVQHNEPNPILVELRVAADVDPAWATARMLDALTYDHRAPEAMREVVRRSLPEARAHARRVLTRLANLTQIGENA